MRNVGAGGRPCFDPIFRRESENIALQRGYAMHCVMA